MSKQYTPFVYETLEDFIADIQTCPKYQINDHSGSWSGARSFEDAIKKAREGYSLKSLEVKIDQIDHFGMPQMEIVYDVSGAVVDMGAFLSGVPENMMDFPITEEKRFVQVYVDVCENSGVDSNRILNKAAAVAYAVDKLESMNYRVELVAFYPIDHISGERHHNNVNHAIAVKIKGYMEKLSVGQIAGCVAPSFQRHLVFRHNDKHAYPVAFGYGSIITVDVKEALRTVADLNTDLILLPGELHSGSFGYRADHSTPEASAKWAEHYITNKIQL